MAKDKGPKYKCQGCHHIEPRWLGRCPECGAWNSFLEIEPEKPSAPKGRADSKIPIPINAIEQVEEIRLDSGIEEINRVLGGGIIKGSSILVGGEPGIGKSTLMLQIAESVKSRGKVLYISGEESMAQIKMRADRLNISSGNIEVFCNTSLSEIFNAVEKVKPVILIIDSIQTLHSSELGSVPGTVTQVKLCAGELNDYAKNRGIGLFLIGHVTKDGIIAGPKVVEHLVDTVLYFDQAGSDIRILRSVKNRFGSTDEIGLFNMGENGLIQVTDPASLFLEHREGPVPQGVAVAPVYEGSRVLLVEIQSLIVPAKGGLSRVFSDRIDSRRISRLAAVLEKHLKLPFADYDIYAHIAGGIKIAEVGIDLAISLALYSARQNIPLPGELAIFGEVSLAGEIRSVPKIESRYKAAIEMGYTRVIGPKGKIEEKNYYSVADIQEAVQTAFSL